MQIDPRTLNLPGDVRLAILKNIPTRPTAEIELFHHSRGEDSLTLLVIETKNQPAMITNVARFNGEILELCYPKYDPATKKCANSWNPWNHRFDPHKPPRFASEEEALCYSVLLFSDVGCPGQARVDMPKAIQSHFWTDLTTEMKRLQAVASVMLT